VTLADRLCCFKGLIREAQRLFTHHYEDGLRNHIKIIESIHIEFHDSKDEVALMDCISKEQKRWECYLESLPHSLAFEKAKSKALASRREVLPGMLSIIGHDDGVIVGRWVWKTRPDISPEACCPCSTLNTHSFSEVFWRCFPWQSPLFGRQYYGKAIYYKYGPCICGSVIAPQEIV